MTSITWDRVPDAALAEVRALYADIDAAVREANPRCDASGRCCRFTEYGHTLFLSHLEAAVLVAGSPDYERGSVTRDGCPFQVNGLCVARDARPSGCRIYFCDPTFEDRMSELSERAVRRLKEVVERYELPWMYAPLHVLLNAAPPRPPGRVPLALIG